MRIKPITEKDLLENILMKEIISIRIDSLWKMFSLMEKGLLPGINEEGATGVYDNKGALIIPGGLILTNSDGNSIVRPNNKNAQNPKDFREGIRNAMNYDGATLIYPRGIVSGIILNNSFFTETAKNILTLEKVATRKSPKIGDKPSTNFNSDQITNSYCPPYLTSCVTKNEVVSYGTRTKLGSCISVCLTYTGMYNELCKINFGLRDEKETEVQNSIRSASNSIIAKDGTTLSPPYIVVCHTARYKDESLTGLTKILGIGTFGEFATLTLEKATMNLLREVDPKKGAYLPEEIIAKYNDTDVVVVLRIYPSTTPGNRLTKGITTVLISPEKDLVGIDVGKIEGEARERYKISA